MTATRSLSDVLDAEREAILWCAAAEFALPEVQAAREAHLAEVRAELVSLGLTR